MTSTPRLLSASPSTSVLKALGVICLLSMFLGYFAMEIAECAYEILDHYAHSSADAH